MYYIEWEMGKKEKEGKTNLSSSAFCPTIYLATLNVYTKFEDSQKLRNLNQKICLEKKMDK